MTTDRLDLFLLRVRYAVEGLSERERESLLDMIEKAATLREAWRYAGATRGESLAEIFLRLHVSDRRH